MGCHGMNKGCSLSVSGNIQNFPAQKERDWANPRKQDQWANLPKSAVNIWQNIKTSARRLPPYSSFWIPGHQTDPKLEGDICSAKGHRGYVVQLWVSQIVSGTTINGASPEEMWNAVGLEHSLSVPRHAWPSPNSTIPWLLPGSRGQRGRHSPCSFTEMPGQIYWNGTHADMGMPVLGKLTFTYFTGRLWV